MRCAENCVRHAELGVQFGGANEMDHSVFKTVGKDAAAVMQDFGLDKTK